jgi:mono/diheme cytochrome c family protein
VKRKFTLFVVVATFAAFCLNQFLVRATADGSAQVKAGSVDFNREIRSIFSDNCFACHGPDEATRKAKLRLDTKDGAFAKPGVIVAGKSAESRLFKRIISKDANSVMPPVASGHKLTDKQIDLVKRWIDEGAQWNEHWAFIAPKRPELPAVTNKAWAKNPIDAFILARLEKEGLKPSPEADRATLIRRLSLDLTGLPPTPADVDAFLADKSADAYEKVVDRFLASPRYGEKMALHWLDLARYADTHGYHIDSHRDMWPWRDWVIKSFNDNKPFDQFSIEQLAGDLLPNATTEQKIASGFNRNHMINFEGGAVPEEYLNEYLIDRVETTSTTWMGLTFGCARCHSHKFDPLSQKEFYQFYAFFNSVPEKGLDGNRGNAAPYMALPTDDQKTRQEALAKAIRDLEDKLSDKEIAPVFEAWEKPLLGKTAVAPTKNLIAHYELDGSLSDSSGRYQQGRTINGDPTFVGGIVSRAVSLDGQTQLSFGKVGAFDTQQAFSFAAWLRPGLGKVGNYAFQKISDDHSGGSRRGFELLFEQTHLIEIQRWGAPLTIRLTANWPNDAIQVRTKESFNNGEWKHLAITYDGSGKAAGLKVFFNGKAIAVEIQKDNLTGSIKNDAELFIGSKATGRAYSGGIDDLRLYDCALTAEQIDQLGIRHPIQTTLSGIGGKRSKEESERLREYFLTEVGPDQLKRQYSELKDLKKQKVEVDKSILNVMVMMELGKPRDTFVLARGDYRNKTEKVTAGVPAVLPPLPASTTANRLALAKWLMDANHPLTARVAVNRYWQMLFGTGLVKTVEDFGVQGEQPVHPELLDWLAMEFKDGATERQGDRAKSWDIKALLKLMVTSATYRQSSKMNVLAAKENPQSAIRNPQSDDPENRLLARGPRHRLQAELVRDNALAVSGLLDSRIGGKSVKPYHPAGLWEEMAFGDGFSEQEYVQSKGKDLYRRSMYTFWKRTVPPAQMSAFDAPDREKCTARRATTNTPLQALVLMNDPTYVEASRKLAERALTEGGKDVNAKIAYAFRLATARKPTITETKVLRELLTQQLTRYRSEPKAAADFLKIGTLMPGAKLDQAELAAWTMVMSAVLNLDETITKE